MYKIQYQSDFSHKTCILFQNYALWTKKFLFTSYKRDPYCQITENNSLLQPGKGKM